MQRDFEIKAPILIYAPNINTGGGLVLIQSVLDYWGNENILHAFLDERLRDIIKLPVKHSIFWVSPTIGSRIRSSFELKRRSVSYERVLMFHGIPPVFSISSRVLVFVQNRLHFGFTSLAEFPFRVATRLFVERLICRLFRFRVDEYIVQTPSMSRDLIAWYGKDLKKELVSVIPFNEDISSLKCNLEKKWDLIYVSDGAAHKNHIKLILALVLLSEQGIFPKLAITLGDRDARLVSQISELVNRNNLRLVNLGHMSHEETLESIRSAGALIFPSKIESFGLPLIESSQLGIPILAPELDYVRDVCVPTQSFDPNSPVSISRAIKRFMCVPDYPVPIKSAKEFIQHVTS